MTQSGENGHKPDASDDMTTYEPAYAPGDDTEPVGWWKTSSEEEEFVSDLPPELDEPEQPPDSN